MTGPPSYAQALHATDYAAQSKKALATVAKLRAIGAQDELDLPRITVIGNQSAGKSSLVEAISGIKVPRDAGTCTRCPMECRLTWSEGPWSCQISIRMEFDRDGDRLDKVYEEPFGPRIYDKNDVELMLRRAQHAVLNPAVGYGDALKMTAAELKAVADDRSSALTFSRNAICVDLEGPELTNLSFVDLPGIIQNAEDHIVRLVEDLVISHIRGNCLILVALPMTDDIENQKAMRLAQQEDPQGRRTIGVATKPDMLTTGATKARQMWLDIIEGRRYPLALGYYCTRQPDDETRAKNVTSTEARTLEAEFFRTSAPWASSSERERFGTDNLIARLSTLLIQIINDSLPKFRAESTRLLDACQRDLSFLPKAISMEPPTYMLTLITEFASEFAGFVVGSQDKEKLIQWSNDEFSKFKKSIRSTAPQFVSIRRGEDFSKAQKYLNKVDEGRRDDSGNRARPFCLDDMREHIKNSKTRELPGNIPFTAAAVLIRSFQVSWDSHVEICFLSVQKHLQTVIENLIHNVFGRYVQLELHIKALVHAIVRRHAETCKILLDTVLSMEQTPFTQNTHYLSASQEKWLAAYKEVRSGKFLQHTSGSVPLTQVPSTSSAFEPKATATGSNGSVKPTPFHFGDRSAAAPFSFGGKPSASGIKAPSSATSDDDEAASNGSTSRNAGGSGSPKPQAAKPFEYVNGGANGFNTAFQSFGADAGKEEQVAAALSALAALGYFGVKADDLPKLLPTDDFEEEMKLMAEARGYFQVSYKRMIDNIPSLIDLKFIKAVGKELQSSLIADFKLGTPEARERCEAYLAEDRSVVAKRKELEARKQRLLAVEEELIRFGL